MPDKYDVCVICNHYYFLHINNFGKLECEACDSPEYPIEKKCPGFRSKEENDIKI